MNIPHFVTCIYCNKRFDRDKLPFKQISQRRYAHNECAHEVELRKRQEELDKIELENYIGQLFGEGYVNARIRKQINSYISEYHYTYSGILKTLTYWFDIKHGSKEKANGGIGIVPFQYEEARKYYYTLYMAKQVNANKNINNCAPIIKEIHIPKPKRKIHKRRRFEFLNEEE